MKKLALILTILLVLCVGAGAFAASTPETLLTQSADALAARYAQRIAGGSLSSARYAPEDYYILGTNVYMKMPSGMVRDGAQTVNGIRYEYWTGSGEADNVSMISFNRFTNYYTISDWRTAMSRLGYKVNYKYLDDLTLVYGLRTTENNKYQLQFVFNREKYSYGMAVMGVDYADTIRFIDLVNTTAVNQEIGIHLNTDTLVLYPGQTFDVVPTQENRTCMYQFTSSKTKCATVDASGKVTAKAKGIATITIKASNGQIAKLKVKVKGAPKIKTNAVTTTLGSVFDIERSISTVASATYNLVEWNVNIENTNILRYNAEKKTFTALGRGTTKVTFTNNFGSPAKTIKVTVY